MQGYDRIGRPCPRRARPAASLHRLRSAVGSATRSFERDCARCGCCRSPRRRTWRSWTSTTPSRSRIRSRPTNGSCAPGCCRGCCAPRRGTKPVVSEAVAIFEVGHGLPCPGSGRRARAGRLRADRGRRARAGPADDRVFDVLDATGVLEARLRGAGGRRPGRWATRSAIRSIPARSASVDGGRTADRRGRGAASARRRGARAHRPGGAVPSSDVDAIAARRRHDFVIRDVPRFPPVRRDLAFVVPDDAPAGAVQAALQDAAGELLDSLRAVRRLRGRHRCRTGTKSLAFSLEFRAPDRTLTDEEADPPCDAIVDAASPTLRRRAPRRAERDARSSGSAASR